MIRYLLDRRRPPVCTLPLLTLFIALTSGSPIHASVTMIATTQVDFGVWQSNGITPVNSQFRMELGKFGPTWNKSMPAPDWTSHWTPFGSASYNETDRLFSTSGVLQDNSTFLVGEQLYLWIRHDDGPASEWFIATNDSSDGNPLDNWVVPDTTGTNQTTPAVIFDLNSVTAPPLSVPFGKTPTTTGGGSSSGTPTDPEWTVQTHRLDPIPEPRGAALVALSLAGLLGRSRSRSHSGHGQ